MTNEKKTSYTPGPCSYDGFGINGPDEYKSRLATFSDNAKHNGLNEVYGPIFAAAPELLEALKIAVEQGEFQPRVKEILTVAIAKAEGKQ